MRVGRFVIDGTDRPVNYEGEWSSHRYEQMIAGLLRHFVFGFGVSRLLTMHLRHQVTVRPAQRWNEGTADTVATNGLDALPRGQRTLIRRDDPGTAWDDTGLPEYNPTPGTGIGTSSTIRFSPEEWERDNAPIAAGPNAQLTADATLVHEIVHALRNSWGVSVSRRFDDDRTNEWWMDNSEEYYATVLMNMYLSERGFSRATSYRLPTRMRMVPNHQGLQHPYIILERRWIGAFFADMGPVAQGLAGLNQHECPYNPFRQYQTMDYRMVPLIHPVHRPPEVIGPPSPPAPLMGAERIFGRR